MSTALEALTPFAHAVVLAVAGLLPIVDPLGGVPIYLQFTESLPRAQQATMAKVVALDSFLLLLASAMVGAYVLDFFGLSIPAVQLAGGMLVCAMAWSLLMKPASDEDSRVTARELAADDLPRRAFYPLTMPLTIGPGSISVAITLGANPGADVRSALVTASGHIVGILLVAVAIYVCYRYAHAIMRALGETGRTVLMRLSAFALLCIGVQIGWNGVHGLLVTAFPRALGG